MLFALKSMLDRRSTSTIIAMGVALLLAVAALDHLTGFELSFSIFYLLPIVLVTWYAQRRTGLFFCFFAAFLWLFVDYTSSHTYSNGLIPIWNTCVRLSFFLVTCSLLVELKSRFEYEAALAKTDGLTGMSNARSFKELVGHYLELAARHRHPVVLGYIDVDNFKTVNDSFGHSEGDRILKTVAITLALCVRTTDVVGKLGGDEFAIFLPETDCAGARVMFGRIHENWRKLRRTGAGRSVSASVSPCSSPSPVTSTKPSRLPTD